MLAYVFTVLRSKIHIEEWKKIGKFTALKFCPPLKIAKFYTREIWLLIFLIESRVDGTQSITTLREPDIKRVEFTESTPSLCQVAESLISGLLITKISHIKYQYAININMCMI